MLHHYIGCRILGGSYSSESAAVGGYMIISAAGGSCRSESAAVEIYTPASAAGRS